MTGNNKFWRASLAGLASVAMLATMGVSAANAATTPSPVSFTDLADYANVNAKYYTVKVYKADKPYELLKGDLNNPVQGDSVYSRTYGQVVTAADINNLDDKYVLDYLSYDAAGTEKATTPYVVTGDVKLYAHYKEAVKVSFDINGDNKIDGSDVSVNVPKGTALTAAEYQSVIPNESVDVQHPWTAADKFAGWTLTPTKDFSSDDLYTGAALNADTKLYQRWDKGTNTNGNTGKNLANVVFRTAGDASQTVNTHELFTVNGKAFPAFRAPTANGTWKQTVEGADYDFSTPVVNKDGVLDADKPDLELVDTLSNSIEGGQDVTVKFDFKNSTTGNNAYSTITDGDGLYVGTDATVETNSALKLSEPVAPAKAGAVFTGWYLQRVNGQSVAYDFSKSIKDNFADATGNVTLYAGWDYDNVAAFQFKFDYKNWGSGTPEQVLYVRPSKSYDLPKLWDYYQTAAQVNALKGEYTTRNVTRWTWGKDVVTKAAAKDAKTVNVFTANWDQAVSLKLDANGGKFGSDTVKWVTKNPGQSWADVVVTPTRDGFSFVQWRNLNKVGSYAESELIANLADGHWYTTKWDAAIQETKPDQKKGEIADGDALKAEWKQSSVIDIEGYRNHFGIEYGAANRTNDIKQVANFGYTEDSAAKYVDAVNALEDEYKAWKSENDAQAKIDKANALAPKYQAAEALLVKADVPVVPTPAEKVAVYRAYNPGLAQVAQHLYTTNVEEYNERVANDGWIGEGIVFYTTSDKTAAPVYRLYNQYTSEHFLTSDKAEYEDLYQNKGWTNEGVAWYIPADGTADLFRLQNPVSFEHLYTTNAEEKDNLTANAGWVLEGAPYKVYAK